MTAVQWAKRSVSIARVEWIRERRQRNRSVSWWVTIVAVLVVSLGCGVAGWVVGDRLGTGSTPVSVTGLRAAATGVVVLGVLSCTNRASRRFDRVDLDLLLSTVSARDVVGGVSAYLYSRYATVFAVPVLSLGVGVTLGADAPASVLTIGVAAALAVVLIVSIGVGTSLIGAYLAKRSPWYRRYRTLVVYGPPIILLVFLTTTPTPVTRVASVLGPVPTGWVVDLALVAAAGDHVVRSQAVGAVVVGGLGGVLLVGVGTWVAERVWYTERVSSGTRHRSHAVIGRSVAERLFAGWVSRPVLTVARKRWVQETRVPRAAMTVFASVVVVGNVAVFGTVVGVLAGVTPLLVAFGTAIGFGVGFGEYILAVEYPSLPVTLTTASGRTMVRGTVLAAVAVGVPATIVLTGLTGVVAGVGAVEVLVVTVVGIGFCVCSTVVATAQGLRFEPTAFIPISGSLIPLSRVDRVYVRVGTAAFVSVGRIIAVVGIVAVPAFTSYVDPVTSPVAAAMGVPPFAVRIGALTVTGVLSLGVARIAYRQAVTRFDEYTLP